MTDLDKIARQMREDWNRRVRHDYRFWMSESHQSDEQMWQSGERDVAILLSGIETTQEKVFLELGCGVGRLLKPALARFKRVIGFDVSETAIAKSKELIGADPKLELHVGDGYSLKPLLDTSVDVAASFAAVTSMPAQVMSSYLREIHRVLTPGGILRMQVYLGQEQLVCQNDTLHLRCYNRENFLAAAEAAAFDIEWVNELILPFQFSFKEIGIEAFVVSLVRSDRKPLEVEEIYRRLLPRGEQIDADNRSGAEIEAWMSINYAKDLAEKGDIDRAQEALDYAQSFAKATTIDVRDLIAGIVQKIEESKTSGKASQMLSSSDVFEKNMAALNEKFPQQAELVRQGGSEENRVEVRQTSEGPALFIKGMPLDHAEKPRTAARNWTRRLLEEPRFKDIEKIVVYGFGGGYHVREMLELSHKEITVIEPSVEVFSAALKLHDLTAVIGKLANLSIGDEKEWSFLESNSELALRPQTQTLFPEHFSGLRGAFYGKRGFTALRPAIAVLGPMQGGTLPITGYTTRALGSLGQRTRILDFSGFAGAFHNLDKFVFDKMRQSNLQNHFVEMMSQVVLETVNEKPIDILICMAQSPVTGRVLTELRKRGVITVLWFVEDFLRFTYWREMAQYYDFIFTIQKGNCIQAIKAAGAGEVHYLPVACDPLVHTPLELTTEEKLRWGSPISFVGAGYHNRQQTFAALCEMPFKIWGTEWPNCKPFDRMLQEEGRRLTPEEYIKIFNATDINLNLHSSTERDGVEPFGDFVNPRTLELAAAGAFQLVDERQLLPELLQPGKEVITFRDTHEMREKIDYYLAHPEERKKIVEAGRARVLRDHTYQKRIEQMLSIIFSSKYERLKERIDSSPWQRMLKRAAPHKELLARCQAAFQRGEEAGLDGLISDIVQGKGKLSETEQKLLFLFHIRKQIIRMGVEEGRIPG